MASELVGPEADRDVERRPDQRIEPEPGPETPNSTSPKARPATNAMTIVGPCSTSDQPERLAAGQAQRPQVGHLDRPGGAGQRQGRGDRPGRRRARRAGRPGPRPATMAAMTGDVRSAAVRSARPVRSANGADARTCSRIAGRGLGGVVGADVERGVSCRNPSGAIGPELVARRDDERHADRQAGEARRGSRRSGTWSVRASTGELERVADRERLGRPRRRSLRHDRPGTASRPAPTGQHRGRAGADRPGVPATTGRGPRTSMASSPAAAGVPERPRGPGRRRRAASTSGRRRRVERRSAGRRTAALDQSTNARRPAARRRVGGPVEVERASCSEKAPIAVAVAIRTSRTAPALPPRPPGASRGPGRGRGGDRRGRPSTRSGIGRRRTSDQPGGQAGERRDGGDERVGRGRRRRRCSRRCTVPRSRRRTAPAMARTMTSPSSDEAAGRRPTGAPRCRGRAARRGDRGRHDRQHDQERRRQGDRERREDRRAGLSRRPGTSDARPRARRGRPPGASGAGPRPPPTPMTWSGRRAAARATGPGPRRRRATTEQDDQAERRHGDDGRSDATTPRTACGASASAPAGPPSRRSRPLRSVVASPAPVAGGRERCSRGGAGRRAVVDRAAFEPGRVDVVAPRVAQRQAPLVVVAEEVAGRPRAPDGRRVRRDRVSERRPAGSVGWPGRCRPTSSGSVGSATSKSPTTSADHARSSRPRRRRGGRVGSGASGMMSPTATPDRRSADGRRQAISKPRRRPDVADSGRAGSTIRRSVAGRRAALDVADAGPSTPGWIRRRRKLGVVVGDGPASATCRRR